MVKKPSVRGLGPKVFALEELEEHPVELAERGGPSRIVNLPLKAIRSNPDQPRKHFDEASLTGLAESIQERGVLQPIIVKRDGEAFTLIAGERRLRAAGLAGLKKIPAIMRDDANALELSLIENIQREDLNPIEEAEGLQLLIDRYGYTHEVLAKVLGKSRSAITEILSLNRLPEEIKAQCRTSDIVTKSQLLQILRAKNPQQIKALFERAKAGTLTVREARKEAKVKPSKGRSPALTVVRSVGSFTRFMVKLNVEKLAEKDRRTLKMALEELLPLIRGILRKLPS